MSGGARDSGLPGDPGSGGAEERQAGSDPAAATARDPSPLEPEGEEPSGGVIPPSDELEAALREASEAVDAKDQSHGPTATGAGESADKLMLEALAGELQALKAEYERTAAELEESKDRHVRLQAEFENFRRRSLKERQEAHVYGHQNLVKDLLTTVDNLERASEHAAPSAGGDLQSVLQGIELVRRELLATLGKHGVTEIEAEGKPFDPAVHEAMTQVPDDSVPANTVIHVLQKGYQLRDRMLRPARVTVSTGGAEARADGGSRDA